MTVSTCIDTCENGTRKRNFQYYGTELKTETERKRSHRRTIVQRKRNVNFLLKKQDSTVMKGLYHRMAKEQLSAVEGYFTALRQWSAESLAAGLCGGTYFDIQPGEKGTMTMTHKIIGPFS